MTIITERFPQCDGCGFINADARDANNNGSGQTNAQVNAFVISDGWVVRGRKHYCPKCVKLRQEKPT